MAPTSQQLDTISTTRITRIAAIAGLYAALSLAALLFLAGLAWGPVQFRLSEAICVLALFTSDAIPGLALGCVIANLANLALSGLGIMGLFDVVFGTLATTLGAAFSWHFRKNPRVALLGPVISNALIVPAYLPLLLKGLGFYTIPFTTIALDNSYALMYVFGLVATGIGEAVVMYGLGLPLYKALAKTPLAQRLSENNTSKSVASQASSSTVTSQAADTNAASYTSAPKGDA